MHWHARDYGLFAGNTLGQKVFSKGKLELNYKLAKGESGKIADDALALITRAAEGSARDATSLLDQALSHGAGETTADQVRGEVFDPRQHIVDGVGLVAGRGLELDVVAQCFSP